MASQAHHCWQPHRHRNFQKNCQTIPLQSNRHVILLAPISSCPRPVFHFIVKWQHQLLQIFHQSPLHSTPPSNFKYLTSLNSLKKLVQGCVDPHRPVTTLNLPHMQRLTPSWIISKRYLSTSKVGTNDSQNVFFQSLRSAFVSLF